MAPDRDFLSRFAVLACLLLVACSADPTGPLESGTWGGTGVSIEVSPDSSRVEFDCAHGLVRGSILLGGGQFSHPGDFVLEHGGPIREGEPPDLRSAVYVGVMSGAVLQLTVQVEGIPQVLGPYRLRRGATPILRKCL